MLLVQEKVSLLITSAYKFNMACFNNSIRGYLQNDERSRVTIIYKSLQDVPVNRDA